MLFRFNNSYKSMNTILEPDGNSGALWLGDYTAAINQQLLKSKGIKTVLTVAQGLNIKYPPGTDIVHKVYNILDIESCNIKRIWNDTYDQINEGLQRGSVLVHCAAGVSRSAATVIAYLMKNKGMSFTDGLQFVRNKRSVICPNFGFQRQLRQYERELGGKIEQSQVQQQTRPISQMQKQGLQSSGLQIQSSGIQYMEKKNSYRKNIFSPQIKSPMKQAHLSAGIKLSK